MTNKGALKTFRVNSQCGKILAYLKTGATLTVEQCRQKGWGANLRSRISDIEKAGYKIKHEMIKFTGGYVARYQMVKGK